MRERIGVLLSLAEDIGYMALDSESLGIGLVLLIFFLMGVMVGAQIS